MIICECIESSSPDHSWGIISEFEGNAENHEKLRQDNPCLTRLSTSRLTISTKKPYLLKHLAEFIMKVTNKNAILRLISRKYAEETRFNFSLQQVFYFRECNKNIRELCGSGSSVGIATELRVGRSGIESRYGRDFPPVQTGPGAHPTSCKMGTGSFPGVKCGRGVLMTTHPLLVPRPWKSRVIILPTLWVTPGL